MTTLLDAKLCINRVKLLVVGDKGVGKTSLIRSFKNDKFIDFGTETNETIYKMEYIGEKRVLFQMVELNADSRFLFESHDFQAILLLFDNEGEQTTGRVRDYITSLNFGPDLKQSIHAVNYFECSAKQMNGVKFIFLEVLSTIEKERKKEAIRGDTPAYSIGCTMGAVGNSGPLIKQAVVNLRECITNPAAFANYKRSITYYLPFIDFGMQFEKTDTIQIMDESDNKIPNEHEQK